MIGNFEWKPYVEDAVDAVGVPLIADQADGATDGSDPPGPGSKVAVPAEATVDMRRRDLTYPSKTGQQLAHPPDTKRGRTYR